MAASPHELGKGLFELLVGLRDAALNVGRGQHRQTQANEE